MAQMAQMGRILKIENRHAKMGGRRRGGIISPVRTEYESIKHLHVFVGVFLLEAVNM
jgi:hypothetical protein